LIIASALSVAWAIITYVASGATLGLLIGSVTLATLIAPPLAVSQFALQRTLIAVAVTVANLLVWMFVLPFMDSLQCGVVLLAFTLALLSLRSASIAMIIAIAWLALPFWMQSARTLATLAPFHPIFAMNGACKSLGIWTQQPILYRLTTLGQDVPYELPASIWRCVLAHGIIALGLLWPARANRIRSKADGAHAGRQTRSTPPPAPQAARTP
jgi:hypothetical protein